MRRIAFVAAAVLVVASCDPAPTGPASADHTAQPDLAEATGPAAFCEVPRFDPKNFSNPTKIDNRFLPLVPGTRTVLLGTANRGRGEQPHRVVFTVTDVTKVIHGVRTVVVWDRDFDEGQLVENELAFFAQDDDGNVWNLGEYPEVFEDGTIVGAPDTWISGLEGAKPGIHMRGQPRLGGRRYLQGFAPTIEFLDCARVIRRGVETTVPFGHFNNVLVTDEVSPLDPEGGHQRKFHAPGVGIVRVGAVGDPEAETLVLVRRVRLSPDALAHVRQRVLAIDARGHKISKVYRRTPPAEHTENALLAEQSQ